MLLGLLLALSAAVELAAASPNVVREGAAAFKLPKLQRADKQEQQQQQKNPLQHARIGITSTTTAKPARADDARLRRRSDQAASAAAQGGLPTLQPQPQQPQPQQPQQPWLDASLPLRARVQALLGELTTSEKIAAMNHYQPPVPRLGLPGFNFWTECLHGHLEQGDGALPTMFPQPLLLAAAFDEGLTYRVYSAISDELRAKSNSELAATGVHKYLTCWTPHINIFRDPRWGRGSETMGEDPLLTSRMAARMVQGLQGTGGGSSSGSSSSSAPGVATASTTTTTTAAAASRARVAAQDGGSGSTTGAIIKVVAAPKHFLGYSLEGAEGVSRYSHNLQLPAQDMADTDLPPFRASLQGAGAQGVMCAYNAVNGTPSCASEPLLRTLLRDKLGFSGYVVSDCNAVAALAWGHGTHAGLAEASAAALRAGVDLFCDTVAGLPAALQAGLISVADLDAALNRTLTVRFLTGQFDPPAANPWAALPLSVVNSQKHRDLAREVVHKGAVLLKNGPVPAAAGGGAGSAPLLPLNKAALRKVCVVGPLADSPEHMMGNYYGKYDAEATWTPRRALTEELAPAGVEVAYAKGMDIMGQIHYDWPLESALKACRGADVGVVVVGTSMADLQQDPADGRFRPAHEGEGLDRRTLDLPGQQDTLVKALARRAQTPLPLVVVLMHGGGFDVAWMQNDLPQVGAILAVASPGQEGGRGIADLLFGRVNPSGRLPITWYKNSYLPLAPPLDLGLRPDPARNGYPGRTYRFLTSAPGHVLYPFGHGLSYTTFSYGAPRVVAAGEGGCAAQGPAPAFCVRVAVANTGRAAGEHVVPLYLSHKGARGTNGYPLQALRGFKRTPLLAPGGAADVEFALLQGDFLMATPDGRSALLLGPWRVSLGSWDAPEVVTAASSAAAAAAAARSRTAADAAAAAAAAGAGAYDSRTGATVVVTVAAAA